jgi:hypothetical protein
MGDRRRERIRASGKRGPAGATRLGPDRGEAIRLSSFNLSIGIRFGT